MKQYDHHGLLTWETPADVDTVVDGITTAAEDAGYNAYSISLDPVAVRQQRGESLDIPVHERPQYTAAKVYQEDFQEPDMVCYVDDAEKTAALPFSYDAWHPGIEQVFDRLLADHLPDSPVIRAATLDMTADIGENDYSNDVFLDNE